MDDIVKFQTAVDSSHAVVTLEVPELDVEHESNLVLDVFPRECIFTAAPYHARISLEAAVKPGKAFPEKIDYEKNTVTFRIPLELIPPTDVVQNDDTFPYGFGQFYNGQLVLESSRVLGILTNPGLHTVQDRIKLMQTAEEKDFRSEHYATDHIQFQIDRLGLVLDGPLPPPKLSDEQTYRVRVIVEEKQRLKEQYTSIEKHDTILLGLIDILLAVSYDRLTNGNEHNEANSHHNVQRISATLSYFVEFTTIAEVLRSFYRRSCTYPYYRGKEISKVCVERLLTATNTFDKKEWIKCELMYTYDIFKSTDCAILNHYYIKDYVRYLDLAFEEELLTTYLCDMEKTLPEIHRLTLGFDEEKTVQMFLRDIMAMEESDSTDSDDSDTSDDTETDSSSETESSSSGEEANPNENVLEKLMNLKLSG